MSKFTKILQYGTLFAIVALLAVGIRNVIYADQMETNVYTPFIMIFFIVGAYISFRSYAKFRDKMHQE